MLFGSQPGRPRPRIIANVFDTHPQWFRVKDAIPAAKLFFYWLNSALKGSVCLNLRT